MTARVRRVAERQALLSRIYRLVGNVQGLIAVVAEVPPEVQAGFSKEALESLALAREAVAFEKDQLALRKGRYYGQKSRGAKHQLEPYGFKWVKRGKKWQLRRDPYTRAFGKLFVEWADQGYSYEDVAIHLLKQGKRTRRGKVWTAAAVGRVERGERRLLLIEARREAEKLVRDMAAEEEE